LPQRVTAFFVQSFGVVEITRNLKPKFAALGCAAGTQFSLVDSAEEFLLAFREALAAFPSRLVQKVLF